MREILLFFFLLLCEHSAKRELVFLSYLLVQIHLQFNDTNIIKIPWAIVDLQSPVMDLIHFNQFRILIEKY